MAQAVVRQHLQPTAHADRRTWDDELYARLPRSLVQRALGAVLRLDPGSRLRRLSLARAFKRAWAAAGRQDWELLRRAYAEDFEFTLDSSEGGPLMGFDRTTRGFDPIVSMFEEVYAVLDISEWRIFEIIDGGDWCVALIVFDARDSTSGAEVATEQAHVYEFVDGAVARQRTVFSWRVGLESVGLGHVADELDRERRGPGSPTTR